MLPRVLSDPKVFAKIAKQAQPWNWAGSDRRGNSAHGIYRPNLQEVLMRKYSLLLSFPLCAAIWLPAQNSELLTVVGCVVARNDGGYALNADNKHYQLAGAIPFQQYAGQKVRAEGTESYSKKPGTNGRAENMVIRADSPTLTVSKIEKLADNCSDNH